MEKRFFVMLVVIVFALVFLVGNALSEQCVAIDEFRECWKTVDVTTSSEYCPTSDPCLATAQAQQHNAITSALLNACEKAKSNNYNNAALNQRIEEVAKTYTGYDITAQQLCSQPGTILTYQSYG